MTRYLYGGFRYKGLNNLGDQIQSIAAERFLPSIDRRFNRDTLAVEHIKGKYKYIVIMNGWFTHKPKSSFPPSNTIYPIFWGFHVTDWNKSWDHILSHKCLDYLKLHEPIGCRDRYTQKRLEDKGIKAFYSQCLTLTLPKRRSIPKDGWNIIVDVPIPLPDFIEGNAIRVTHKVATDASDSKKMIQAHKLLSLYRDKAIQVITTKLHCALPCIAMGIPVIFFGDPGDYRLSIIKDIGLKTYNIPKGLLSNSRDKIVQLIQKIWNEVDWSPSVCFFEKEKKKIVDNFEQFLRENSPVKF